MKNIILITLLVSQASSLTWIVSLEARLTERNPTVFLHPYDTPAIMGWLVDEAHPATLGWLNGTVSH